MLHLSTLQRGELKGLRQQNEFQTKRANMLEAFKENQPNVLGRDREDEHQKERRKLEKLYSSQEEENKKLEKELEKYKKLCHASEKNLKEQCERSNNYEKQMVDVLGNITKLDTTASVKENIEQLIQGPRWLELIPALGLSPSCNELGNSSLTSSEKFWRIIQYWYNSDQEVSLTSLITAYKKMPENHQRILQRRTQGLVNDIIDVHHVVPYLQTALAMSINMIEYIYSGADRSTEYSEYCFRNVEGDAQMALPFIDKHQCFEKDPQYTSVPIGQRDYATLKTKVELCYAEFCKNEQIKKDNIKYEER
ncbi:unnamed protein product [Mytilus edulis]|uniref:Death domain-containing protein n=1 Tax=Mytilus edulis TaxID=6550 RepID=A0A8S3REF3_MYTED|nr:unnamed protein product [Mytilus edulis]